MAEDELKEENTQDIQEEVVADESINTEPVEPIDSVEDLSVTDDEANKKPHEVEFTNDSNVDKAVDQIVNEESTELMESQDKDRENQFASPAKNRSVIGKVKGFFSAWWRSKKLRYGTFVGLFIVIVAIIFVPSTRYIILNLSGVRVNSSMSVVDSNTGLPLRNIPVTLQGQQLHSDDEGKLVFSNLKLGKSQLLIEKIGYAKYEKNLTLGWGSNPLGGQALVATGTQFTFVLSDWLSNKTVVGAEASSGENMAQSDDLGKITLIVGVLENDTEAILSANGYRDEIVRLSDIEVEDYQVKMVPAKKHVFVSNRNGQYDLYTMYVDGQDEEVLLAASGKEREVPFVLPHQTSNSAAYISSRAGEVNKDNFILDGLFIIDVDSGESRKVARSEQLQLIGWSGDKLVYVAVVEGVSAGNSQRSRIYSYDVNTGEKLELASSNYFNDVKLIENEIYYAVSSYAVPQSAAKLFIIDPDGTDKKNLVDTQVWTIIRADHETVVLNAINAQWFEQKIGDGAVKLDQVPVNRQARYYSTSPNDENSVWVDVRDGKGVLIKYDIASKIDEVIRTEPGLSTPVYWLSDSHLVYRVSTNQETADYVLSLDGGEPRKISDVLGNRSRYFY